ncbi:MAG TPA: hypothetical protein VGF59_12365 [Bryobacteraceae bacterium]
MRRSAHSKIRAAQLAAALSLAPLAGSAQQGVTCAEGRCTKMIYGSEPATVRLRVNGHGPVTVLGGASKDYSYVIKVTIRARSEGDARRVLANYTVKTSRQGEWFVLTAPGGAAMSAITMKAPHLEHAAISTSDGAVDASGIDGSLEIDSQGGALSCDRVRGDCKMVTGGGPIFVGQVNGGARCATEAGNITVASVGGEAVLQTKGGDILAKQVGGAVQAETGGGGVRVDSAGGAVTAVSGGGQIQIGKAGGVVTIQNMAGPVQVGSAAGVRCESGSGVVRVTNIYGPMRVSTLMGSIFASLMGSEPGESYLATGNGDITVMIASNVGVNIRAENRVADIRRIVSEFPGIPVRVLGARVVAEGPVNGGGPLLGITGTGGTIFIKRQ